MYQNYNMNQNPNIKSLTMMNQNYNIAGLRFTACVRHPVTDSRKQNEFNCRNQNTAFHLPLHYCPSSASSASRYDLPEATMPRRAEGASMVTRLSRLARA